MQLPLQSYRWDEATYSKTVLAENIFDYENIISAYIVLEYVTARPTPHLGGWIGLLSPPLRMRSRL